MPPPIEYPIATPTRNSEPIIQEKEWSLPGQVSSRIPVLDNSTTETFVSGLQRLGGAFEASLSSTSHQEGQPNQYSKHQSHERDVVTLNYDYVRLDHDSNCMADLPCDIS
jgi:hypothetical protein